MNKFCPALTRPPEWFIATPGQNQAERCCVIVRGGHRHTRANIQFQHLYIRWSKLALWRLSHPKISKKCKKSQLCWFSIWAIRKITGDRGTFHDDENTFKQKKNSFFRWVIWRRLLFDLSARSKETWENRTVLSKRIFLFLIDSVDETHEELSKSIFLDFSWISMQRKSCLFWNFLCPGMTMTHPTMPSPTQGFYQLGVTLTCCFFKELSHSFFSLETFNCDQENHQLFQGEMRIEVLVWFLRFSFCPSILMTP